MQAHLPSRSVPVSFFGIVLGLTGLGNAWRIARLVWGLPGFVSEALLAAASLIWLVLIVLYTKKWLFARSEAVAELMHITLCCFVGLVGVSTMLVAGALIPYSRLIAQILFGIGAVYTLCFAVWRMGLLSMGDRDPSTTTAVLYLPGVAGSFVMANVAGALGYPDWGQYAFGAGLFSWLAIESVLLHRLYTATSLAPALRPTLGIQLAPPVVGAVAYMSITNGAPGFAAHALLGYGLLQALLLLRLLPWIREEPFGASYWAFSFGVSALAVAPLRMLQRGDSGAATVLAPVLFVAANAVIALLAVGTLREWALGRLLPPIAGAAPQAPPPRRAVTS
jgi:tellurite resistance protein